jgi:hypothetical protein
VGAAASDDLHRESDFYTGWVMVKTASVARGAFLGALRALALYASTGPAAEFSVRDVAVTCATDAARSDSSMLRASYASKPRGPRLRTRRRGTRGSSGSSAPAARAAAWSQPFWLAPI